MAGIDAACEEGLEMRAQIAPRSIGAIYGLSLSQHAFYLHPTYKAIEEKSLEEKVAVMRDPATAFGQRHWPQGTSALIVILSTQSNNIALA